jgi:membrane fusion protein, heavy metal efflux system
VVDRVIDAASNSFRVRLELPNPNYQLPPGLRCKVDFDLPAPAADGTKPKPRAAVAAVPTK